MALNLRGCLFNKINFFMKNISGISELMFYENELDIDQLLTFDDSSLMEFIDDKLCNESVKIYCLDGENEVALHGNELKVELSEGKDIDISKLRIYLYERLESQNVQVYSGTVLANEIHIELMNRTIFADREMTCFSNYSFFNNADKLADSIESESYGSSEMKQFYIVGEDGVLYNIDLLNDDVAEELSSIQDMIAAG